MVSLKTSLAFAICAAVATSLTAASTLPPSSTTQEETTTTTTTTLPTTTTTQEDSTTTTTTLPTTTTTQEDTTTTTTSLPTTTTQEETTTTTSTTLSTTTTTLPTTTTTTTTTSLPTTTTQEETTTTTAATTTTTATSTTTTPAPQPPYQCHDCNSGSPFTNLWHNENCDENGTVTDSHTPTTCSTFCFTSVGLYPAGTVFRGCASALYLGEDEPQAGCFNQTWPNRHVCLCAGDECNTNDLTQLSEYYAQLYTDMQNAAASNTVR